MPPCCSLSHLRPRCLRAMHLWVPVTRNPYVQISCTALTLAFDTSVPYRSSNLVFYTHQTPLRSPPHWREHSARISQLSLHASGRPWSGRGLGLGPWAQSCPPFSLTKSPPAQRRSDWRRTPLCAGPAPYARPLHCCPSAHQSRCHSQQALPTTPVHRRWWHRAAPAGGPRGSRAPLGRQRARRGWAAAGSTRRCRSGTPWWGAAGAG